MLLIEMQCKDWEHTRVNFGIIELCHKSFPDEKIKLYAECEHIRQLDIYAGKQNIEVSANEIDFADWRFGNLEHSDDYAALLEDILEGEQEERCIILLSGNKGIIRAASVISSKYTDRKVYITLHGSLEEVTKGYHQGIKQRVKDTFLKVKDIFSGRQQEEQEQKEYEPGMKECIEECMSPNCFFLLYAPSYKKYLSGRIDNEILNRFIFLHHPLYEPESYAVPANDKMTIGIYGQAVNQNAYDIVCSYNEKYDNGRVRFQIMTQKENRILTLENVSRLFEQDHVSNEELEQARRGFDYVLIPYDRNQYKVKASGILCDVLSEEIPVLMLDSPLLEYYGRYGIGELKHTTEAMAAKIAALAKKNKDMSSTGLSTDVQRYRRAVRELKKQILQENIKTFREMIG